MRPLILVIARSGGAKKNRSNMATRKCKNCRYWQYEHIDRGHICVCADSEERADWTDADFGCEHWAQELEQDGEATWYFEEVRK